MGSFAVQASSDSTNIVFTINLNSAVLRESITYIFDISLTVTTVDINGDSSIATIPHQFSVLIVDEEEERSDDVTTDTLLTLSEGEYAIRYTQTYEIDYAQIDCEESASVIRAANAFALNVDIEAVEIAADCDNSIFTLSVEDISEDDANDLASTPNSEVIAVVEEIIPGTINLIQMSEIDVVDPEDGDDSGVNTASAGFILSIIAASFVVFAAGGYMVYRKNLAAEEADIEVVSQ